MFLGENEYRVLQMLIEGGWRVPRDPATNTLMKPRQLIAVQGGNAVLAQLRRFGFLDDKNQPTDAGRQALRIKKLGSPNPPPRT
jgi:hypothetical protein